MILKTIHVKPADGITLYTPSSIDPINPDGEIVEYSIYIARAIIRGDLIVIENDQPIVKKTKIKGK